MNQTTEAVKAICLKNRLSVFLRLEKHVKIALSTRCTEVEKMTVIAVAEKNLASRSGYHFSKVL